MNINSTEEQRYEELKGREINVIPYRNNLDFFDDVPNDRIIDSLKDFVCNEVRIIGKVIELDDNTVAKFTKTTLKKSIYETCENRGYLKDLFKIFSMIEEIGKNSIIIKCEKYRYPWDIKSKTVTQEKIFISAFYDKEYVYPVKIVVEERVEKDKTALYLTVTTKRIIKKDILETGVHINKVMESQHAGDLSFSIKLSHFISFFNDDQDIIIKYLPSQLLDDFQIIIKNEIKNKENKYTYKKYTEYCAKHNIVALSEKEFGNEK